MLLLASAVGFLGCILFIVLLIVLILSGKKCTSAVVGFALSIMLLLGGGILFTMTEGAPAEPEKPANVQPANTATAAPDEDEPDDAAPEDGDTSDSDSDSEPNADMVYRIGDTWTVDGQWSVVVTGVSETSERNRYSDKNPEAVYILDFVYTNLGYEKTYSDGIFISLGDLGSVVDSSGMMAYSYPLTVTNYPQNTPVGAACTAQSCIGVDHAGDFKIIYSTYDANGEKQTATFEIEVN